MLVGSFSHICHIWSCPHHDLSMLVCSFLHIWWHQPPTTTFQCLFARSRANSPPRPFSECLLFLSPTSAGAPTAAFQSLLARSCTSGTTFQRVLASSFSHICWCPHHDLSMLVCSFLRIWYTNPRPWPFNACLFFLSHRVVPNPPPRPFSECLLVISPMSAGAPPPPTTTVRCLWVRSCTSGGANPPPRPFSECALVFFSLARAAVWCKGYCGNW